MLLFQVYSISCDGNGIQELLTSRDGITKATRVSVHKSGDRLLVVNKDGGEIYNYQIKVGLPNLRLQSQLTCSQPVRFWELIVE